MKDGNAINCTFNDNTAKDYGGAICGVVATNCNFTCNSANIGGAMNGGSASNCSFVSNSANLEVQ